MSFSGLIIFCSAYFIAAAVPGPGIAALMARVLAHGLRGTPAFIAGFVAGDLFWFALAAAGMAFLVQTFATLFVFIKFAGGAYLLFLAVKLWTAPARIDTIEPALFDEKPLSAFLGGLFMTLSNPKAMLFFMALLPTVVDLTMLDIVGAGEIAVVICVFLPLILSCYVFMAARARRLFNSARTMSVVNKTTGTIMAGAAVAVASR